MKAYQVVLVDGDGATFEEFVTPKVFINKAKAQAYRQFLLKRGVMAGLGFMLRKWSW